MEAIPILVVVAVALILWVYALVQRRLAVPDTQAELVLLRRRADWLQRRIEIAHREDWDLEMISPILEDLAATSYALAKIEGPPFIR